MYDLQDLMYDPIPGITLLDEDEESGQVLFSVLIDVGELGPFDVTATVDAEGMEWLNADWQGPQPKSFAEINEMGYCMHWCRADQLCS